MLTENSFKILTGMILLCVLLFASERADQNSGKVNSKGASHITGEHIQGGSDSENKKNNGKKRNLSGPVEIEKTPSVKMKNNVAVFSLAADDFIDLYNGYYRKDHGDDCIKPLSDWYFYVQHYGRLEGNMHYEFTADKRIWTLPTISIYTPEKEMNIKELTVNFDDHSYTDKMYEQYEEMCFYTLKVFFPHLDKKEITALYKEIIKRAYEKVFQGEEGFQSGNPPSDLYYEGKIGVYPYFAYGESVRICVVPVTKRLINTYKKKGTVIHKISK